MLMKTKQVLLLTVFILLIVGWRAPVRAQEMPVNYNQNPNIEHEFSTLFWSGWDDSYFGIYSHPQDYKSDQYAHSGNHSLKIWVQTPPVYGTWIWVSYPVRGQEQKHMKASFWYRGYLVNYWNFIYRDAGMTFDDLHPKLAEYVGADSSYWGGAGQDAIQFHFGGDDEYTEDWTYFEFVWDFPGTIPGWGNTAMWYAYRDSAYVDDIYYGEWFDGVYNGEEPFGFVNGDFERSDLGAEWGVNIYPGGAIEASDFISEENHTEAGFQSLRLMDYMQVSEPDTNDVVAPYDSISIDTSFQDRNITYYLPAMNTEGDDMELSFWYKGNDASVSLEFYDDYGVTPNELPLPAGAILVEDWDNATYDIINTLKFDDESSIPVTVLGSQNFDDANNLALTGSSWCWSGAPYYDYNEWDAAVTNAEAHSGSTSLWLPGDPAWTGAEGTFDGIVDDTTYIISFWYKGKAQFELYMGSSLKYDLVGDPDDVVPAGATADKDKIHWILDANDWTQFTYIYNQGSWLADSSVSSPAKLKYDFIGIEDNNTDVGYVDDILAGIIDEFGKPDGTTFTVVPDTLSVEVPPLAAKWELPAVNDWTEWKLNWTNPSADIGSTLTFILDNEATATPDWIKPDKLTFDDENAGWTYFDDFVYEITTGIDNKVQQKQLHLYPNPVVDMLYLSIEEPLQRINIYNSLGQLVKSVNNPDRKINVSDLSSGMYMLNVTDQRGIVYKSKFIKE